MQVFLCHILLKRGKEKMGKARKFAGRILAMATAFSIALTGISFPAKSAETEGNGVFDAENCIDTDSLDEFQEAVTELNGDLSLETNKKFSSKRLVAVSDCYGFDTFGAESVISFENMHVLSYETEKECADAYSKLSGDGFVDSVEIDALMEAESLEDEGGEEREALHTVNAALKDFLDSKEAEKGVRVAILDTGIFAQVF